jgi:hypothetical protein
MHMFIAMPRIASLAHDTCSSLTRQVVANPAQIPTEAFMLGSVQDRVCLATIQGDTASCALGKGRSGGIASWESALPCDPLDRLGILGGAFHEILRCGIKSDDDQTYIEA